VGEGVIDVPIPPGLAVGALPTVAPNAPPSSYAIDDLVHNRPNALPRTIILSVMRLAAIVPGLYLAGHRKNLVRTGLYVTAAVSVGMFALKWAESRGVVATGGASSAA
jgi:hypothetical protein